MTYSTQKNTTGREPSPDSSRTCFNRLRCAGKTPGLSEGGMRTKGIYKESSTDTPLVSVITVVKNNEKTIEKCINSVLQQTYTNIEYILIDGASTDGTLDTIHAFGPAIDYYCSGHDDGIYDAMNKGLSLASGEYILFLNSDDYYTDDAVSTLIHSAISTGADVTHANAYMTSKTGEILHEKVAWLHDGIYTRYMPLRHETMLVKSSIYNTYGYYDSTFSVNADYAYVIKIYDAGCSFHHVDKSLMYHVNTGLSHTADSLRLQERFRIFSELFPFLADEDVDLLSNNPNMNNQMRLELLTKYRGYSELFARSMAFNIADMTTSPRINTSLVIKHYLKRLKLLARKVLS